MADIFLSYASEDRERIRPLVEALEVQGWSVWWDRRIQPGQSFDNVIQREIDEAGCVVVAWTEHSIGSEWVKNEATIGLERGVLVPVLLDEVRIPLPFVRTQSADLRQWSPERVSAEMQDFLTAVAGHLNAEPPAPVVLPKAKPPGRSRRYLTLAAIVLAIAIFAILELRSPTITPLFKAEAPSNTVVVASFKDNTPVHAQDWIRGTIVSELRVALPDRGLQVVGAATYGDEAPPDVDARYLLTGTVGRFGNVIHVTAELISTDNQHLVWQRSFDEPFADSDLNAQREIAAQMANAVARQILEGAPVIAARPPEPAGPGALDDLLGGDQSFGTFPTMEGESDE